MSRLLECLNNTVVPNNPFTKHIVERLKKLYEERQRLEVDLQKAQQMISMLRENHIGIMAQCVAYEKDFEIFDAMQEKI